MENSEGFYAYAVHEDSNGRDRLNADDAAQWFIRHWNIITRRDTGEIYYFTGEYWSPKGEIALKETLEEYAHELLTRNLTGEIIEHVRRGTYKDINFYVPGYINLENGVWNIEERKLEPHSAEFYFDYVIPNSYIIPSENVPAPKCDKFLSFLQDITEGDVKMSISILEALAYSLIPGHPIQKAVMLVGEGSNGKSTLLGVLRALLGPDNVSHATIQSLASNRFAVEWLQGKLANIAADLPSRGLYDTGIFKSLTGGDPVVAEVKRVQKPVVLNPGCKLYFSANQIPDTPDDTDAFYRRWFILEFKRKFPEGRDILPEITDAFERAGLLALLLNNFVPILWERKRFTFSQDVEESRSVYTKRSDTVKAFAEERLRYNAGAEIPKSEMYEAYVKYCESFNLIVKSDIAFWRKLKQIATFEEYRPERGSPFWVRGQELLPAPAPSQNSNNVLENTYNTGISGIFPFTDIVLQYKNNHSIGKKSDFYEQGIKAVQNEKIEGTDGSSKINTEAPNSTQDSRKTEGAVNYPANLNNAATVNLTQMAMDTLVDVLSNSKRGLVLGSGHLQLDFLPGQLFNALNGPTLRDFERGLTILIDRGQIIETRPGEYKLVV